MSLAVVQVVAAATDCDPASMPPLFPHIDPDALEGLFGTGLAASERTDVSVRFRYAGRIVTVDSHGVIRVDPGTANSGDDSDTASSLN